MLVLTITLVPTLSVSAKSYTADDNYIMSSNYHDFYRNYFGDSVSYQYFPYKCYFGSSERECYFGIDKEGNYADITYKENGYGYSQIVKYGVDESFSVSGKNIYKVDVSSGRITNQILVFVFLLFVVFLMLGAL